MNRKLLSACLLTASMIAPALSLASAPDGADGTRPAQFVTDSAVTTAVKTRLVANQMSGLTQLEVESAPDGTVWLRGTASTQEAADRAVELARNADGVMQVKSTIVVTREAR